MHASDIKVQRLDVPESEFEWLRNKSTVQSAIVRGDTTVTLHNLSSVPKDMWDKIRFPASTIDKVKVRMYKNEGCDRGAKSHSTHQAKSGLAGVRWKGFQLEFIKVLAAGGHGFVTLWRVWFEGGVSKKIVIKKGVGEWFNAGKESRWHLQYDGAEHTTQLIDLYKIGQKIQQDFSRENPLAPLKYKEGEDFDAGRLNIVVFEFLDHGDLYDMLVKVSKQKLVFSDQILWGIWECLVRGIAAVAYTAPFRELGRNFEEELCAASAANELNQFFKELDEIEISHDVHLDLEEFNILAGKADTHPFNHILKLHDLGAFSWSMNKLWPIFKDKHYWEMRKLVKTRRATPEQVHQEWDRLPTTMPDDEQGKRFRGLDLTEGCSVAGRYGIWTSIFLISKAMEAVITLVYHVHPFKAGFYQATNGLASGKTYGWLLTTSKYDHVDMALRDIVSQCQFGLPAERPSITTLLRKIEVRKQLGFDSSNEDMAAWWKAFFGPEPEMPEDVSPPPETIDEAIDQAMADDILPGPLRNEPQVPRGPVIDHPFLGWAGAEGGDGFPLQMPGRGPQDFELRPQNQIAANLRPAIRNPRPPPPPRPADRPQPWNPNAPPSQWEYRGVQVGRPPQPGGPAYPQVGFNHFARRDRQRRQPQQDQPPQNRPPPWQAPPDNRNPGEQDKEGEGEGEGDDLPDTAPFSPEPVDTVMHDAAPAPGSAEHRMSINRAFVVPDMSDSEVEVEVEVESVSLGPSEKRVRFDPPRGTSKPSKASRRTPKDRSRSRNKGRKPRAKTNAIESRVKKSMLDMPVAIRNLLVRTQHLDRALRQGAIPPYAYVA
ncbi:hypothetical protein ACJZ2D_006420 [Fusarium nematophilum]